MARENPLYSELVVKQTIDSHIWVMSGGSTAPVQAPELSIFDFENDGLEMSVFISLFSDRRILFSDGEPPTTGDRRGWWADKPLSNGDYIGSKLWTFLAAKLIKNETVDEVQEAVEEALQWLIDDKVANEIDVSIVRNGLYGVNILVKIKQPDDNENEFKIVWNLIS